MRSGSTIRGCSVCNLSPGERRAEPEILKGLLPGVGEEITDERSRSRLVGRIAEHGDKVFGCHVVLVGYIDCADLGASCVGYIDDACIGLTKLYFGKHLAHVVFS